VEPDAFAKQNHRRENRFAGLQKAPQRTGDPLRPSSPLGFRPDGRNGLPENRRNPGRTSASRQKGQRKMTGKGRIANSCETSGAKTQQPPPTPAPGKSGIGVGQRYAGRAISLALVQVPSGPLAKEKQKACQTENRRKWHKRGMRTATSGQHMPTHWAPGESPPSLLHLI